MFVVGFEYLQRLTLYICRRQEKADIYQSEKADNLKNLPHCKDTGKRVSKNSQPASESKPKISLSFAERVLAKKPNIGVN